MRATVTTLLALALTSCGGGGEGTGSAAPRSALVVTLDTTRHDALTCMGGPPGASPRLDALAAEGVVYSEARTVTPLTLPSHSTIMTGLTPLRHTVHTNSQLALPSSATTLAERARAQGLQTAAFVAAVVLADTFGLAQGFEHYDQPSPPLVQQTLHYDRRRASDVADSAVEWIEELDPARPFFAWAHFFDPHLPLEAPQRFVDQVSGASPYHAEVAAMDHAIGRILDALDARGLLDETLVVVVADHGEGHGDHGEETHGTLAYDSTLRVPMIVRYPDGFRAGERSDEVVSVTDVYPTLVEALQLGALNDVDGISLFKREAPADRGVYFETYYGFYSFGWSPIVGWADRRGKYLFSTTPEYFVAGDRAEAINRIDAVDAQDIASCRAGIAALGERPKLERGAGDAAEQAVISAIQALGYTGAGGDGLRLPPPLEELDRPSPTEMNEVYRLLLYAQDLSNRGEADQAIPAFHKVLGRNPTNAAAWFQLGGAQIQAEQYEASIESSRRAIAEGHGWYGPYKNLGLANEHLGRPEEALLAYEQALETAPMMIEILNRCVTICDGLRLEDKANRYRVLLIEAREAEAER